MNFLKAANIKNKIIILYQKRLNINFKGFFPKQKEQSPLSASELRFISAFFFLYSKKNVLPKKSFRTLKC